MRNKSRKHSILGARLFECNCLGGNNTSDLLLTFGNVSAHNKVKWRAGVPLVIVQQGTKLPSISIAPRMLMPQCPIDQAEIGGT